MPAISSYVILLYMGLTHTLTYTVALLASVITFILCIRSNHNCASPHQLRARPHQQRAWPHLQRARPYQHLKPTSAPNAPYSNVQDHHQHRARPTSAPPTPTPEPCLPHISTVITHISTVIIITHISTVHAHINKVHITHSSARLLENMHREKTECH